MAVLPLSSLAAPAGTAPVAIEQIPVCQHALGSFPFLNAPTGYSYHFHEGIPPQAISDFGREYFAVNGKLYRQEGKTFKTTLEKARHSAGRFNQAQLEASYERAITALGGVKLHDGKISREERDRIGNAELVDKQYGHSLLIPDHVQTYVMRQQPSLKLSIEGHTDNTGTKAHNQALSRQHAETVVTLLRTLGIAASRLQAVGHGASQARVPNDTPENRALNRRVVLVKITAAK